MSEPVTPPVVDPPVVDPAPPVPAPAPVVAVEKPWSEFVSGHPDPAKLEPYKNAKSWAEVYDIQSARLAEAQTALRSRPAPAVATARPADDAPADVWTAWRASQGIPETPDGYALAKPEGIPDTLWNAEEAKAFSEWAHKEGLHPDLVKKLVAFDASRAQQSVSAAQQQQAQQAEQMRLSEAAELGKRFGDRLDPVLKDLQSVTQAMGKDPGIFDPQSDKFWGVEAVQFAVDLLKRVPRGEDGTVRNIGAPAANGAYDKAWAKASMVKGHPDYEARTDPRHPRHAEISRLANEAYALG